MKNQAIDLHNAITTLSGALDLVGVDEVKHGKRVGMMAYTLAKHLNWSDDDSLSILYAGMLHDCGVSKIHEHRSLTTSLEWEGAEHHCIRGSEYLAACPVLARYATEVRYHHTRWEKLITIPIENRILYRANLLFLADRIDVLQAPFLGTQSILTEFPAIINRIESLSGMLFAPELVAAFVQVAQVEAFWLKLEGEYLDEDLQKIGRHSNPVSLTIFEFKELARMFSRVVDAKTPFTDEHSQYVAKISRQLASEFGIAELELEHIEIAGLLHDIGKLRVSEDILEKPGSLSAMERACMHRHSYDTFRILNRVFEGTNIPLWAGFHHETLLGSGYPFGSVGAELDLECRIIAVADIFQALAQDRPYRKKWTLDMILDNMYKRVESGNLDAQVVDKLAGQGEKYYRLATQKAP